MEDSLTGLSRPVGSFIHRTIQGYSALLKRGVYGNQHNVSGAHLSRYLAKFDFRYDNRSLTDAERSAALLIRAKGNWLFYGQPD